MDGGDIEGCNARNNRENEEQRVLTIKFNGLMGHYFDDRAGISCSIA